MSLSPCWYHAHAHHSLIAPSPQARKNSFESFSQDAECTGNQQFFLPVYRSEELEDTCIWKDVATTSYDIHMFQGLSRRDLLNPHAK
jgi:hypothetical protein